MYNYTKSDNTLKMQLVRMQLEALLYSYIKLGKKTYNDINEYEEYWLNLCHENEIIPDNSFKKEFLEFEKESLLKFAPEHTFKNMVKKVFLTLERMNVNLSENLK